MKKWLLASVLVLVIGVLAACGGKEKSGDAGEGLLSDGKLVVGVTAGPHEEILGKVKELAAEEGLEIEVRPFTDYVMPNVALAEKEIDINSFQTEPFFEAMKEDRNLDLLKVADTVTFPMGIYSSKVTDLADLEEGAKIGLPGDPTNSARALMLFEAAGLLKLEEGMGMNGTIHDIVENPKNYDFIELDSAQIARQLDELDAAAINTNFAIEYGLSPSEDSIFSETSDSPYVNLIAVRAESKDDEVVQQFIDIYRSEEVKKFIEENFDGSIIPSW
ncbi:MetQ/NlpA family ABC transporter substrate-binding protein [Sporosarcina pasteurii]|uniref:Lipoprotein n=1 Tax=Sporosarcina pasteurii TaxID=1474 RepID=A0A380BF15_SPOPA|nr:MetQ/NlpA family ABC transporter substrate-binding protein [Sporosarcina pasteurii]MDS9472598.1 MetQ/NlpA family ABC transporter substrate-binding protein [Sporosarcina pasteurii]QBQ06146.1 MetQ/NlpA family ABC transporter substrate-binding protein [Sporosarcina pasteurii]SUI99333.1 D-methionine-binding lipoprotein metQ precursor [Sporosarcina pasteurii]